jgi:hypothetical protein
MFTNPPFVARDRRAGRGRRWLICVLHHCCLNIELHRSRTRGRARSEHARALPQYCTTIGAAMMISALRCPFISSSCSWLYRCYALVPASTLPVRGSSYDTEWTVYPSCCSACLSSPSYTILPALVAVWFVRQDLLCQRGSIPVSLTVGCGTELASREHSDWLPIKALVILV